MPRKVSFKDAKRRYVHRFTMEFVPTWAREVRTDGTYYAPQFASDAEWYDATTFPGEGELRVNCKHCETSGQTWPLGKALAKPYRVAVQLLEA